MLIICLKVQIKMFTNRIQSSKDTIFKIVNLKPLLVIHF